MPNMEQLHHHTNRSVISSASLRLSFPELGSEGGFTSLLTSVFLLFAVVSILWHQKKVKGLPLPPGPRQLPIIGNIGQINPARQHPQFLKWARQYGAIFRVRFGSNNLVVLNTAEATIDLLDRRSAIYSCRAGPHFAHDLMSAGQRMVFLPYAKEWKVARASLHPYLMGTKSTSYRIVQEHESSILMGDLLHFSLQDKQSREKGQHKKALRHEDGWEAHVRRYTTSVVMNITYGKRITSTYNNHSLHKIYDVLANLTVVGQPGRNPCDSFPLIRRLPNWLAPWRLEALRLHEWEMELWGGLLNQLKQERADLKMKDSFVNDMLTNREKKASSSNEKDLGLDDNAQMSDKLLACKYPHRFYFSIKEAERIPIVDTAATVLEAGSDTTASSVYLFVLACLNDPTILKKLQEEIDSVVPRTSLPTFEQVDKLPYLRSCVKETLRRRSPTIMGIPHRLIQDDIYDGMLIPKDSIVIGNVWALHMDQTRYPEPHLFKPERFLSDSLSSAQSAATMDPDRRDHYAFGWGRRVCQGMHIAEASLLIIFARLAWSFDFECPEGEQIMSLDDEDSFLDGFVSQTKAFPCTFKVRNESVQQVLRSAYDEAQMFWAHQDREEDVREHMS